MFTAEEFMNYANNQSNEIEGWFFPADMLSFWMLNSIQRSLGINGNVCEVGVYHGKSLVLLSQMLSENELAHAYDLFPNITKQKTEEALSKFGDLEKTRLYAGDTSDITQRDLDRQIGDGFRLLHIDAGHEYHEVMHQLFMFAPYVQPGGIIIMDDYHDREFPGIEAAVLDFAEIDRPRRFLPFFASGNKMFLCEPNFAFNYQAQLLEQDNLKNKSRVSRVRDFNILIGFSKLPMPNDKCLAQMTEHQFPMRYDEQNGDNSEMAKRFSQLKYGPGKHKD